MGTRDQREVRLVGTDSAQERQSSPAQGAARVVEEGHTAHLFVRNPRSTQCRDGRLLFPRESFWPRVLNVPRFGPM